MPWFTMQKKYAKKADTSLSSMVENYLKAVASEKSKNNIKGRPKNLNSVTENGALYKHTDI